jgi:hypothetical protein
MKVSARVYLSPMAALVTMAIGVGVVWAGGTVATLFESRPEEAVEENIGVSSTENFKSFQKPKATHGRVLACYDPTILPLWHELKNDEVFNDLLSNSHGVMNCSDMIAVDRVDLDGDGSGEFVVRGKSPYLCSASSDCGFWVFEKKVSQLRKILAATDYVQVVGLENPVQNSGSNGYSNLLLMAHPSASQTSYRTFAYDGGQYVETRCVFEVPKYGRKGEGSMELIPCAEFGRREGY